MNHYIAKEVPSFIMPLVDEILAKIQTGETSPTVKVTHPDYTKQVGVDGNYSVTTLYLDTPSGLAEDRAVHLSHLQYGDRYTAKAVIFETLPGETGSENKNKVHHYYPHEEMLMKQEAAKPKPKDESSKEEPPKPNPAALLMCSDADNLVQDVVDFLLNDKHPA